MPSWSRRESAFLGQPTPTLLDWEGVFLFPGRQKGPPYKMRNQGSNKGAPHLLSTGKVGECEAQPGAKGGRGGASPRSLQATRPCILHQSSPGPSKPGLLSSKCIVSPTGMHQEYWLSQLTRPGVLLGARRVVGKNNNSRTTSKLPKQRLSLVWFSPPRIHSLQTELLDAYNPLAPHFQPGPYPFQISPKPRSGSSTWKQQPNNTPHAQRD